MHKKALIHNPYWDTLGGGERYTVSVIHFLLSQGWTVDIVWPENISSSINARFGIDISTANYVSHEVFTAHYNLAFYVSDGSLPLSFARKTLVHFQFPFTAINGSTFPNQLKSKFYSFVCNSQFTKSFIDREFSVTSDVIYPPIDTSIFKSTKKTKTIVYIGRFSQLTQFKNHNLLLEAFKTLQKSYKGWQLILAGGVGVGADQKYIDSLLTSSKNLPITILQNPSFAEIKNLYSSASIFWSAAGFGADESTDPTRVEHFGISLVEAMASGCVPIVSNLGGHKEIVHSEVDGFLIDDTDALITQTVQLIKNPAHLSQLGKAAMISSKRFDTVEFNLCLQKYL